MSVTERSDTVFRDFGPFWVHFGSGPVRAKSAPHGPCGPECRMPCGAECGANAQCTQKTRILGRKKIIKMDIWGRKNFVGGYGNPTGSYTFGGILA